MSLFNWQTFSNPFQGMMKDDSAMRPDSVYRHIEVNRFDVIMHHLWTRSGFINCFDSSSDSNCPNNIVASNEDAWEYPEIDNPKNGCRTNSVWRIMGVTKDNAGNPLGNINVTLFLTAGDIEVDRTISDSSGNYILWTPYQSQAHYCVATNNSTLAGATVNTLIPS